MYIDYYNKKIKELCTNSDKATIKLGKNVARTLFRRLGQIAAHENFKEITAQGLYGCHKLSGNRKDLWGIDIDRKNRIVCRLIIPEGDFDLEKIITIIIREVGNYHG